jgi:hypothetical protein
MKNERKEKKSQSSFLNFQAISEPCEATVLRGSVERERDVWDRWHPYSHRHRKLPRSSFAFWGWRAWLGPNTFCLTKNLLFFSHLKLTYLLAHKVSTVTLGRWRSHGRHPTSTVTAPTSELLRKGFI